MKKVINNCAGMAILILMLTACKKDFIKSEAQQIGYQQPKILNEKEKKVVAKFEYAYLVLQGLFSQKT